MTSRIRKAPASPAAAAPSRPGKPPARPARETPGREETEDRPQSAPHQKPPGRRPARPAPLSGQTYSLTITLDEESHADLQALCDLMAHQVPSRDPAEIVKRALALLHERTLAQKAAVTDRPRTSRPSEKRTRHIPAWIRRAVWQRDGGRCTYRDTRGRRCTCRKRLEYHHTHNWAEGGEHSVETITLRCRAHNQLQAELDYGKAFMETKRRGQTDAREKPASYRPSTMAMGHGGGFGKRRRPPSGAGGEKGPPNGSQPPAPPRFRASPSPAADA